MVALDDPKTLLELSGSAELGSEHPLSVAVTNFAKEKGSIFIEPESFEAILGQGVKAKVREKNILIGN
jgi:Cu+-exporting ATPase